MLIAQNVFQGFAVVYFRLQTLIRVELFLVAAYYTCQFRHLVYARQQQGLIAVCKVTKIDLLAWFMSSWIL